MDSKNYSRARCPGCRRVVRVIESPGSAPFLAKHSLGKSHNAWAGETSRTLCQRSWHAVDPDSITRTKVSA